MNGLNLERTAAAILRAYADSLLAENEKVNLVSRSTARNIWSNHIIHSLSILFVLDIPPMLSVLDLGTGGGLPGIPLAIVRPDIRVTLLDSIGKKVRAVERMLEEVGIGNARVVHGRAEDPAIQKALGGEFDLVVARAVAPLKDLIRWSHPLVRRERGASFRAGRITLAAPCLAAMKGGDLEAELVAWRGSGGPRTEVLGVQFRGMEEAALTDKKIIMVEL
ncbi:MAG: 16S rRNA (guanine(527)-N(7))-methyltransferase RsmG [Bacteroidota bacterium]